MGRRKFWDLAKMRDVAAWHKEGHGIPAIISNIENKWDKRVGKAMVYRILREVDLIEQDMSPPPWEEETNEPSD